MFEYVRGQVYSTPPQYVAVEAGGIAYKVYVPKNHFGQLPEDGEEAKLFLSVVVRETSQTLYGFISLAQRELFEILLGISGVGPKMALAIMGHLSVQELRQALCEPNTTLLCQVPGVGKKSAERLVMEVKNKTVQILEAIGAGDDVQLPSSSQSHPQLRDAISALTNLGYRESAAEKALQDALEDLQETPDLASLITFALQKM